MPQPEIYQKPPLVTIFGGSGFVGRYVAEKLAKRGYRLRIACRFPEKAYHMLQIGAPGQLQMARANVADEASVARAAQGAEAVIYLPGIAYQSGKNSFRRVHIEGAGNVARQAAKAGARLAHISVLSRGLAAEAKNAYLSSKAQGEEAVRAADKKAIILRPSLIFGAEDRFFNRFANWARFTPALPLFGGGQAEFQPVYAGDVAEMAARAAEGALQPGKTYELGGPEILSFRELMEEMLRVIRRRRAFIRVPMLPGALWGGLCGLAGKMPLVPTVATAGQIRLLGVDSVVSDAARHKKQTLEGAGITPRGLDIILPTYLWRFRVHGQFSQAAAQSEQRGQEGA